jgi:hypothetical protein
MSSLVIDVLFNPTLSKKELSPSGVSKTKSI